MEFCPESTEEDALASMEIPARRIQRAQPGRQIDEAFGDQQHDVVGGLYLPIDAQQTCAKNFAVLLLGKPGMDDNVDDAGFVFDGDEHALGRARFLAASDDTGGAARGFVGRAQHFHVRSELACFQFLA